MIELFPIPIRSLVKSSTKNPFISQIQQKAWQISQWSDSNINFLMNYATKLLYSRSEANITVSNVIGSHISVDYEQSYAEGILILWNIAAILSDSLNYFPIDDKTTREIYKTRISTILKIFYSIQTEFLPAIKLSDKSSDLNLKNIAFYHTIYSAHLYEAILMNDKSSNNYLVASKYFRAAERMNPFPRSKFPFNNKSILYHIKALVSYSKELETELSIGPSIYILNLALSEFSSSPRDLRNSNADLENEIKAKLISLEEDNKKIYFDHNKSGSMPEIVDVDEALHTGLVLSYNPNKEIKEHIEKLSKFINEVKKGIINTSESLGTLTSLIFECDSIRKQMNSSIFTCESPDLTQINKIQNMENEITALLNWVSSAKSSNPVAFDIDNACEHLNKLQGKLNNEIGSAAEFIDTNQCLEIFESIDQKIKKYEIPQTFNDEIAQKIDKCFKIMESI
ncbi:hypothetical protein TRFO_20726 [Tritrichomonas foetus]|uniref:BRO1 domain-containing protein n=1 Tax=Tritrichomonas foetus TaxID=1144522 RepID=A0A1J4KF66_9EUKA|nr:hypothetical protein TRFO_20726 [Tritrichomonas foetus]|eukprot:OHT10097.1 hypothetical protein TRFO_20726 [Tritrichomonas foetus]